MQAVVLPRVAPEPPAPATQKPRVAVPSETTVLHATRAAALRATAAVLLT